MDLNKEIERAIAKAVRGMPDAHLMALVTNQFTSTAVPEPEPRRKRRRLRKAVPEKTHRQRSSKPKLTPNETRALAVILKARNPLTVQDIAKAMKTRTDTIRPTLKGMADKGIIEQIPEGKGKKRVNRWLFGPK